jgi:hypothetical protein
MGEKALGIVVAFIEREPSDGLLTTGEPFADEGGFAKPGRGRDEGNAGRVTQPVIETLDEAGAEDCPGPGRGNVEFGGEDGDWHDGLYRVMQFRKSLPRITRISLIYQFWSWGY